MEMTLITILGARATCDLTILKQPSLIDKLLPAGLEYGMLKPPIRCAENALRFPCSAAVPDILAEAAGQRHGSSA